MKKRFKLTMSAMSKKVKNNYKNSIRLFSVSLKGADDISGEFSLADRDVKRVHKTPLLDLDTITDKLTKNWQKLDNLEGITFGPTLPNGHKTLILVSDNNFSRHQRTLPAASAYLCLIYPSGNTRAQARAAAPMLHRALWRRRS